MVLWERGEASEAGPCFQNRIWPAHGKYIVIVLEYCILYSLKLLIFRDIHEVTFEIFSAFAKTTLSFHYVIILGHRITCLGKEVLELLTFFF